MATNRQRDPVLNAPFWPQPEFSRGSSRSQQRRWGELCRLRGRANLALQTLKELANGEFTDKLFSEEFSSPLVWSRAGALGQQVSERMMELEQAAGKYPSREDIDVALGRLVGRREPPKHGRGEQQGAPPARGDVWPMCVEKVDLPPPGTKGIPLEEICPQAAHLFSNMERLMLDPAGEEKLKEGTRSYQDPALRSRRSILALSGRMWVGGMLRVVSSCRHHVSLFSVIKKVVWSGVGKDARWDVTLRLIFDNREGNLSWRAPPWVPLGGPGPLSSIDLSRVDPASSRFSAATGDVANWYYRLLVPAAVAEYFVVPEVSSAELREFVQQHYPHHTELPDPQLGPHIGVCVLVMGWTWAVFLAHTALTSVATSPRVGWPLQRILVHGSHPPDLTLDPGNFFCSGFTSTTSGVCRWTRRVQTRSPRPRSCGTAWGQSFGG